MNFVINWKIQQHPISVREKRKCRREQHRSAANVDHVMIEIDGSECTRRGWGGNGEIITMARTNVCRDNQKWINTFLMCGPGAPQTESFYYVTNYIYTRAAYVCTVLYHHHRRPAPFLFIMVIALLFELPAINGLVDLRLMQYWWNFWRNLRA